MTITWQLKTIWNALHNTHGLKCKLIRYLKQTLTFPEVFSMLLACCTFLPWVPGIRGIVLLSFKKDFASITSAFVCSVSLEDDGIRPSTFSLPNLLFTPQCPRPQTEISTGNVKSGSKWHENEQGQISVLHGRYNSASNWTTAHVQVDLSKQHLSQSMFLICFQYAHVVYFGVLGQ